MENVAQCRHRAFGVKFKKQKTNKHTNMLSNFHRENLRAVIILRCHRRKQQGYCTVQVALAILHSFLARRKCKSFTF